LETDVPASASHPIGCHVEVIYRSRELTFGKINPPTFDVIVGVVSLGQRCFQDFAAEDFVDQQRRDVALAARRIVRWFSATSSMTTRSLCDLSQTA